MAENCFCHLNGYEVKDAVARDTIDTHAADKNNPHGVTAAQVGARPDTWTPTAAEVGARPNTWLPSLTDISAAPAKKEVMFNLESAGWYRVGHVLRYHCCRMVISTRYGSDKDMGAVIDICATHTNPVINITASAFTDTSKKQIDQVRLVDSNGTYFIDVHYSVDSKNGVFVTLDGPEGAFSAYTEWEANATGTAAVTVSL